MSLQTATVKEIEKEDTTPVTDTQA